MQGLVRILGVGRGQALPGLCGHGDRETEVITELA